MHAPATPVRAAAAIAPATTSNVGKRTVAKHHRHRRVYGAFVQRHRPGCACAGDRCGERDALRAERRQRDATIYRDDARTMQLAASIGLNVRTRGT